MAKVTSKLQVTIPKALAQRYRIAPGDDIEWRAAGSVIQIAPGPAEASRLSLEERLELFDQASLRHAERVRSCEHRSSADRGWSRADLYDRARD